jgi:hypothetical protein
VLFAQGSFPKGPVDRFEIEIPAGNRKSRFGSKGDKERSCEWISARGPIGLDETAELETTAGWKDNATK